MNETYIDLHLANQRSYKFRPLDMFLICYLTLFLHFDILTPIEAASFEKAPSSFISDFYIQPDLNSPVGKLAKIGCL